MLFKSSLADWRETTGRHLLALDFEPRSGETFAASLAPVLNDPTVRITRLSLSPGYLFRDGNLLHADAGSFSVLINRQSNLGVEHGGAQFRLRRGEATVLRNWEPGRVGSDRALDFAAIVIPADEVCGAGSDVVAQCLDRNSTPTRLLAAYVTALENGRLPHGGATGETAARHIVDLARLCLIPPTNSEPAIGETPSLTLSRQTAIEAMIATRFRDPGLCAEQVAAELNISRRYLELLLQMSGTSFGKRLRDLRLDWTFDALQRGEGRHISISAIAYAAGFSDLSHFNRKFKARFGCTPSDCRSDGAAG